MDQEQLKKLHAGVLEVLKGLTVQEAQDILRIVNEDISANAIIGDRSFV